MTVWTDPDFDPSQHAVYYVRAIEASSPAINADALRCTRDGAGECIESNPCFGDYRTPYEDDCLSETAERAWSSPLFIDYAGAPG